ncbi:MAG: hypothetical protein H7326_01630, partial [Bdellovibrionaceae bacterium]|nr:hypothetical protein [Pseudobdellovibrionaceae bacterium]
RKTLEKAKIPSADEVAQIRLNKFMALLSGVAVESRKYQVALGIFQELVAKDESGSLNAGTAPELLARVITALHPEMLAEKDYDLDFLRGAPLETRNPRGDRDGHTLSGGNRNYERRDDRGGSRGSDRGGYSRGGDSRGGYDRAPSRERFEPSSDRRSAAPSAPRFADRDVTRDSRDSRDSRPSAAAPVKYERSERTEAPRAQYGAASASADAAPAKKRDYYVKKADRPGYVASENSEENLPKRDRGPRFDGFDFGDGSTRFANKDERKPRAASATAGRAPSPSASARPIPVEDKRPGGSRPPLRRASDHPGITRQRPSGAPKRRFRDME